MEEGQVTIQVNGQKAVLKFDGKAFEAKKESIALTDPRLSNVWGKEIYRISLTAKQVADKEITALPSATDAAPAAATVMHIRQQPCG